MLKRAYSFLHVKAVDGEKRIITGTATTPTPDRMGDIVEPLGVKFKNPLPLLLHHNTQKPVGWVKFTKPTEDGIGFEAKLPTIDEPGAVRDRIEEAWTSIKTGLLAGVSIGFRAIEEAFNKETGGVRFLQTEVLELSLVAIPAQPDARIDTIKSLDIGLAATGTGPDLDSSTTPGASGRSRVVTMRTDRSLMKTYTEKIVAFKAEKDAKLAKMNELGGADEGSTMDTAQQETFDTLVADVKSIDEHLARLETLETMNKAAARPVEGDTAAAASASRGHQVITVKSNEMPGVGFTRVAMCLASANGNRGEALEIAKARYPNESDLHLILKTAVAAGTTTDATWAGPLVQYQNYAGDFIEYLRPQTILGKFGQNGIPALNQVPFNVRIAGQTSGGSGYWVGQGAPKPLTKFDFSTVTMGFTKVANIAVLTEETVRFSSPSAEMIVRNALAKALIARLDVDFVDPSKAAVANVSPASITNGVVAITPSGTNEAAVIADIGAIFAPFIAANISPVNGVWIMSPTTALSLSLMRNALGQQSFPGLSMTGGTFQGMPVIVSQYVAGLGSPSTGMIVLVDASEIWLADDGQVVVDVSREASLQMDDAPTNNSATPTATSVVSMFQTNSVALRAERFINWQVRRAGAVQYLSPVAYVA